MRLVRLACLRWDVLALPQMLDDLVAAPVAHAGTIKSMLALLRESVPRYGPQKDNPEICKYLKFYDLWEFRKQPRRGKKLRVVWFEDGSHIIVCVAAFAKERKTPDLSWIEKIRHTYFNAKAQAKLEIQEL